MMAATSHALMTLQQLLPDIALPDDLAFSEVAGIALDSRKVEPGFLFLAVPGLQQDGRAFISQAFSRGAVAVAADAEGLTPVGSSVIAIDNLGQRVSEIAARFYAQPSRQLTVTGITGTNGKTTCCQLLGQLFSLLQGETGVIGTLGSGIYRDGKVALQELGMTTPDAVLTQSLLAGFVTAKAQRAVMEVSSHSLDQGRVASVQINTAVFTNLSRDHLDYHGSMSSYAEAKLKIFNQPGLQAAVVNADDPLSEQILQQLDQSVAGYRYGLGKDTDIGVRDIAIDAQGIRAQLHSPWGTGELVSGLLGHFNLANLLAVIAVACVQGFPLRDILRVLPQLQPVTGRMERVGEANDGGPMVIVDYAHTPDALEKTLLAIREHCAGDLWCVFGCGGDRDRGKRKPMGEIATKLADRVVLTSDNPRSEPPRAIVEEIQQGAPDATAIVDRAEAIAFAIKEAAVRDIVLVAGKGHEDYQEIAGIRTPFNDCKQALAALKTRSEGHG